MAGAHPLDRPVWSALTGGQAHLAVGEGGALRFPADFGPFAATVDRAHERLAALAGLPDAAAGVAAVEVDDFPVPDGMRLVNRALINQMTLEAPTPPALARDFEITPLTEADAEEIFALATLTRPGPFAARTHQLGDFFGVKVGGAIAAMAGERMRPTGFTEVSAVCTHPDHRGHGYGAALTHHVAARILARGEAAFLHCYPDNAAAISVYEALGFRLRRTLTLTVMAGG